MRKDTLKSEKLLESQKSFVRSMIVVSVLLLLVALIAVSFEGYTRLSSRQQVVEKKALIKDISSRLDRGVLEKIEEKRFYSLLETVSYFQSKNQLPEQQLEENQNTPESTSSGQVATPSGERKP